MFTQKPARIVYSNVIDDCQNSEVAEVSFSRHGETRASRQRTSFSVIGSALSEPVQSGGPELCS